MMAHAPVPRISAIETEYGGIRFRSRLEARWAVFFDAQKWRWEYEPEGYAIGGVRYLPDFWMPTLDQFWEVKPESLIDDTPAFAKAIEKAAALAEGTAKTVCVSLGFPYRDAQGGLMYVLPDGSDEIWAWPQLGEFERGFAKARRHRFWDPT